VIVKTDGLLILRDLGSTNGTRVNGQRIRRAALLPNDQLSIASFKFRINLGPDEDLVEPTQDRTQQLDAAEVAKLLGKSERLTPSSASGKLPVLPVHPNPLPDVYPEEEGSKV
jgi:pSer/pThr/pTyr-binding forkhead associated (FHA) protein